MAQQRAPTSPPIIKFGGKKNLFYLFMQFIDNFCLKYYDFIFAPSVCECRYLKRRIGKNKTMRQKGGGFDFDLYAPRPKRKVREEIGLSIHKKLMIHVGRFTKLKGIDVIIEVYKELKKKRDDIELVFIGGNENQPLYKKCVKSGAFVKGHIPKGEVLKYLNAADVYLLPTEDKRWISFGDIDNAIIEALAMNRPVVSPMLIHFAGTEKERKKLGIITKTRDDVLKAVEYILEHPAEFENSREIMKKYYNWEAIIENNVRVYDELCKKYYGGC